MFVIVVFFFIYIKYLGIFIINVSVNLYIFLL